MIKTYKDIDHETKEGMLLLIAIGSIVSYEKHIGNKINHDDVIEMLQETNTSIQAELLINKLKL